MESKRILEEEIIYVISYVVIVVIMLNDVEFFYVFYF